MGIPHHNVCEEADEVDPATQSMHYADQKNEQTSVELDVHDVSVSSNEDVPDSWMDLAEEEETEGLTHAVPPRVAQEVAFETTLPKMADGSGHSRQRKHLVNLNKAALKWQKSVELGTLAQEEMLERIKASPAATHLRTVHKHKFEEDKFVEDVLKRAMHLRTVHKNRFQDKSVEDVLTSAVASSTISIRIAATGDA